LETHLRLPQQSRLWAIAYAAMALCILACGGMAWLGRRAPALNRDIAAPGAEQAHRAPGTPASDTPTRAQRMRWCVYAFLPSSLVLGVTSYLGTDIASIPLLWIIPLAIYLLSFTLVFARRKWIPMTWLRWLLPPVALGVLFQIVSRGTHPVWLVILIHLLF